MSGLGGSGRGVGEESRRGGDLGTRITRTTSLLPTPSEATTSLAALADTTAAAAVVAASAVTVAVALSTAAVADFVAVSVAAASVVLREQVSPGSASPVSRSGGFSDGESGEVVAHRGTAGAAAVSRRPLVAAAEPFAKAVPYALCRGHSR